MVRGSQMNQKQMAYHYSPYRPKRLMRNGVNVNSKSSSSDQQQIYSTFKPPDLTKENKDEGKFNVMDPKANLMQLAPKQNKIRINKAEVQT